MRKSKIMTIGALASVLGATVWATQKNTIKSWNFDSEKPGEVPAGFRSESGDWKVVADDTAPSKPHVIAQLAKSDEQVFNIALLNEPTAKNVDFQVKFRVVGGKIDQGGGLIWRAKDAKNYYLYRFNPIERNIRVYKVMDGVRTIIHTVEDVDEVEGWQSIRVVTNGKRLEGHLNGEARFSINNEAISDAGKVGLWSKADAQTHFDDLQLEIMDR